MKAYARDRLSGNWFEVFQVQATCQSGLWWVEGVFGGKFLTKELWGVE
jgi:hypothetical protein